MLKKFLVPGSFGSASFRLAALGAVLLAIGEVLPEIKPLIPEGIYGWLVVLIAVVRVLRKPPVDGVD